MIAFLSSEIQYSHGLQNNYVEKRGEIITYKPMCLLITRNKIRAVIRLAIVQTSNPTHSNTLTDRPEVTFSYIQTEVLQLREC